MKPKNFFQLKPKVWSGLWVLLFLLPLAGRAQSYCDSSFCSAGSLNISTGYDHARDTTYLVWDPIAGKYWDRDNYWELIEAPGLCDSFETDAYVINKYPVWNNPFPGSQWISGVPGSIHSENNPEPKRPFTFRHCFCTCGNDSVLLEFDIQADDYVDIFMDTTLVASFSGTFYFTYGRSYHISKKIYLTAGTHCIYAKLRNIAGVAMGLNISGKVEGGNVMKHGCCSPGSKICGKKYYDKNGNGTQDVDELGIPNWLVYLKNGSGQVVDSIFTDIRGEYCFNTLTGGSFKVEEAYVEPWTQTEPGGGVPYSVTLGPDSIFYAPFGNWVDSSSCFTKDSALLNTGFNPFTETVLANGEQDSLWQVVSTPINTPIHHSFVVNQAGWNGPLPSSKYISSKKGAVELGTGVTEYRRCFCMQEGFTTASLELSLRADDSAAVFLNGVWIGSTPRPSFNTPTPYDILVTDTALFDAGKNCITMRVYDQGALTGLNVAGIIKTSASVAQRCCWEARENYPDSSAGLQGSKFLDKDKDGNRDLSDPGITGWKIYLKQTVGGVDSAVDTTSGTGGVYEFQNLAPGTYKIYELLPPGWIVTRPLDTSYTVTLSAGEVKKFDFLNFYDDSMAKIRGKKWNDLDEDGVQDPGEPGIPGWVIVLSNGDTVTTDANGNYEFSSLPLGTYTVSEVMQHNWYQTFPSTGSHSVSITFLGQIVNNTNFGNRLKCFTEKNISINSIVDSANLSANWYVITDPDPVTPEPRLAMSIFKDPIWQPAAWMSGAPTSTGGALGTYEYERCFCMKNGAASPMLSLNIRADEEASVYLNGNLIGLTGAGSYGFPAPVNITTSSFFIPGRNCVRIVLTDLTPPVRSGFSVSGNVTTLDTSLAPDCCDNLSLTGGGQFVVPPSSGQTEMDVYSDPDKPTQKKDESETGKPWIGQNIPNPYEQKTVIPYFIPPGVKSAAIRIVDTEGKELKLYPLEPGTGNLVVEAAHFAAGTYFYYLVVDDKNVDSKKMVLVK